MNTFKLISKLVRSRMSDWLLIAVILTLIVWLVAPKQLPVSLYKLSLISLAAVAGYWIDRSLFPYARPDAFLHLEPLDPSQALNEIDPEVGPDSIELCLSATPDDVLFRMAGIAMLRRAVIVASTMLAVGLGA